MKTFSLFVLVAVGVGSAFLPRNDYRNHFASPSQSAAAQISDGAFRDGLYLGKLAAERGAEPHVAIARWATPEDRSSFTAGYQQGYSEFLVSRVAATAAAQN
jgi:hypothetical protein